MGTYLTKTTWDRRVYDVDFTDLLDDAETITAVTSVTASAGDLAFGAPFINTSAIAYPKLGRTAAAGKVVQVRIDDGEIPDGAAELFCEIAVRVVTTASPRLEAVSLLRLFDGPG